MANETSKTTSPGNASSTPQQIPLAQIRDLPGIVNIRTYTPKDLGGLVSSIQSVGVREPIIVRRSEDGMYQLLAGQRRRKASELAKKTTIPALVYEMTLEEARSYHKAQALNPKAVIPGKLVTLSADEPSRSEEKPPAVPAADKDKQNEKPAPTAPIKSDPTKAEEKTPVVPLVADKDKETEKSASVVPAKSEAVKVEEKSAAAPANADKSKEAEKPAAATPAKSEPAKTEGKMSATPAAMDKGKEAEKSAPAASTKAAPAKPAAMPAGPAAVGPTGTAITQVFDARLNPPDEKALKDLPIPKEGESYFITLHPAYLERSKYNNFSVDKDSDNFKELYKAVELTGIKDPVLARPKEGGGLEILSGQRRHLIGTELNYPIPTIIQRIDDADAKILVADSNLHRDKISTYDLSRALKMKMEGMKQKAGRKKKGELGEKLNTDEAIAKEMGITVSKFNRMLRMSEATKDVCSKVDDGTLALSIASALSFLKPKNQDTMQPFPEKYPSCRCFAPSTAAMDWATEGFSAITNLWCVIFFFLLFCIAKSSPEGLLFVSVFLIVYESGPFKAPLPVSLGSLGKGFALGVGWVPCSIQKAALFIAFHRAGQPVQQRLRREANLSGVPIFTPVILCEVGIAVPGRHHLHAGIFCKVLPECLQHPFKAQHPYHILFRCIWSFMGTL